MHIISRKRLREFWTRHPHAEIPLRAWHQHVRSLEWRDFAAVRATYRSADVVGKSVVFNIGGNKFRLIAEINYSRGKVFVRHVLTHEEYDRGKWKQS